MSIVKKAVIPAAGYGMRFLPVTKAIPKEMLPIVDTPTIEYIVREAVESGITDILIIVSGNKNAIIDHFDRNFELESKLIEKNKKDEYSKITDLMDKVNIYFVRQKEMLGLGHAVLCAKSFVGDEPFALLLGDDLWQTKNSPAIKQLIDAYNTKKSIVLGVQTVGEEVVNQYGICGLEGNNKLSKVNKLIEKPKTIEEAPGREAICGRYVLTPDIFSYLETQKKGAGDEIQLTDSIARILNDKTIYALKIDGKRYDIGSINGFVEATLDYALNREDTKEQIQELINEKARR